MLPLFISLFTPLRNEYERRTKMCMSSGQLFTCIFQYVIGYGGRNSLVIDQFVHVHKDPFHSLCFCLELVHGMQSIEAAQSYASYPPYLHVHALH